MASQIEGAKGKLKINTFYDIYKYLGRSKKANKIMESLKYESDSELDRKGRFAKENLKKLIYGRVERTYRKLIGKRLSYNKPYVKDIVYNIGLLSASRLQLNMRLVEMENEMSTDLQEYTKQNGEDSQTYNSLRRLFSHPTDIKDRCHSWIILKCTREDIEGAEATRRFIRLKKRLALEKIRKVSMSMYKKIARINRKMEKTHKIIQRQELEEEEELSIVADALHLLWPQYNSFEDFAKDPLVKELITV